MGKYVNIEKYTAKVPLIKKITMSSHQPFNTVPPIGEVQHIHFLSEHIGGLFLNDEYSDVTLVVESNRFNAHKVILAARSEYFRALLYGGMKESQLCEIELKDTPLSAFKHLLRYIYMGHMTLGNQKDELILEILGLAHKCLFGLRHGCLVRSEQTDAVLLLFYGSPRWG